METRPGATGRSGEAGSARMRAAMPGAARSRRAGLARGGGKEAQRQGTGDSLWQGEGLGGTQDRGVHSGEEEPGVVGGGLVGAAPPLAFHLDPDTPVGQHRNTAAHMCTRVQIPGPRQTHTRHPPACFHMRHTPLPAPTAKGPSEARGKM